MSAKKWRTVELYKFEELGASIVLDVKKCDAYIIDEIDKKVIAKFSNPITVNKALKDLSQCYPKKLISKKITKWQLQGLIIPEKCKEKAVPFQDLTNDLHLTLNVTNSCNLRCKYCYVKPSINGFSFMNKGTARKAVDFMFENFPEMNSLMIGFFGGEPLLNFPVIKETIIYTSKKAMEYGINNVKYHISTNGTILTNEMIRFFKRFNVEFLVSIDGDSIIHDSMRVFRDGGGTHKIVLENLKKLVRFAGSEKVGISAVITHNNSLLQAYNYFLKHGIKTMKFGYVRYTHPNDFTLTNIDKKRYIEDLKLIAKDVLIRVLRGQKPPYPEFNVKILHLWTHKRRLYFCPAGIKRFAVAPNGEIYPCGPAAGMDIFRLGNVSSGLNLTEMNNFITYLQVYKKRCLKCWARYLCAGGCPLDFVRVGDEKCEISKTLTRLAIAIYSLIKERNQLLFTTLISRNFANKINRLVLSYA